MANKADFSTASRGILGLNKPTDDTKVNTVALKSPVNPSGSQPSQPDALLATAKEVSRPQIRINDGLGYIPIPKRQGRDATLYLSNDVLEAVAKAANRRGISKSKIVDYALRKILLSK